MKKPELDKVDIGLLLLIGFLIGFFVSNVYFIHSYKFQEQTKGDCIQRGFYNVDEVKNLRELRQSDLNKIRFLRKGICPVEKVQQEASKSYVEWG